MGLYLFCCHCDCPVGFVYPDIQKFSEAPMIFQDLPSGVTYMALSDDL